MFKFYKFQIIYIFFKKYIPLSIIILKQKFKRKLSTLSTFLAICLGVWGALPPMKKNHKKLVGLGGTAPHNKKILVICFKGSGRVRISVGFW
jgi:hypothetical protein